MHLVYDENGHPVPHGAGGHSHAEAHADQEGCGMHEHCGACGGEEGRCHDETLAMLAYMIRHNMQHAAEIDKMAAQLDEKNMPDAAEQIRRSVSEYQKGNMYLNLAFSLYRQHLLERGELDI